MCWLVSYIDRLRLNFYRSPKKYGIALPVRWTYSIFYYYSVLNLLSIINHVHCIIWIILPRIHVLNAAVLLQQFAVHFWLLFKLLSRFDALIQLFDVFDDDAVAVGLEKCVVDILRRRLAIGKVNWCDFDEMFNLPQTCIVLGDVFDDGDVRTLEIMAIVRLNHSLNNLINSHQNQTVQDPVESSAPSKDFPSPALSSRHETALLVAQFWGFPRQRS